MLIKKIACVAVVIGLVLHWGILPVSAVPTLSIAPSSQTVQPGQSLSLNVFISDITDLYAFQFDLAFNPTVLSAASITEGTFLPGGGFTSFLPGTIDNTAGSITFTADTLQTAILGMSGSGTLATVDFQSLSTLGTSPITLSNVILLDSNLADITASRVDGNVTVTNVPEPATFTLFGVGLVSVLSYSWFRRHLV